MQGDRGVPFPRRVFLARGVWITAALALGSLGSIGSRPAQAADLRALDAREFAVVKAIARRMIDDGADPNLEAQAEAVARRIDHELSYWTDFNRGEFKQLLGLFEDWTLVLGGMLGPFTGMRAADQDRYLASWATSGLDLKRQAYVTLKTMVAFFFYTQDETWPRIGYDGPWVKSAPMALD